MRCILCEKEIENYSAQFNRLEIESDRAVDICNDCVDRFIKWQGKKFAALFPTKVMKKRFATKGG